MDLQTMAMWGGAPPNALPANTLNAYDTGGATDWNAILANGIRGAAQAAIAASVGEKFDDGQLVNQPQAGAGPRSMMPLLLLGLVAYMVLK